MYHTKLDGVRILQAYKFSTLNSTGILHILFMMHTYSFVLFLAAVSTLLQNIRASPIWIRAKVLQVNLFRSVESSMDVFEQRSEILATRLYVIFLVTFVVILVLYTTFAEQIRSVTVSYPSQDTYERLQAQYPTTLKCPCEHISIKYGLFISILPTYHPVCSSIFLSDSWINSITAVDQSSSNDIHHYQDDFLLGGQGFSTTLASFCEVAQATAIDAGRIFNETSIVSSLVLPPQGEFAARVQLAIDQFILSTPKSFQRTLELIRYHTQGNQLLTTTSTNGGPLILRRQNDNGTVVYLVYSAANNLFRTSKGSSCSCALTDQCQSKLGFYLYNITISSYPLGYLFALPSMFIGCLATEAVLQSSLECYFNQTCVNAIQDQIRSPHSLTNVSALNFNGTEFSSTTPIETLIDMLMIDKWTSSTSFSKYYAQCAPVLCVYTYSSRYDWLYVITTLVSLFGGLSTALRLFAQVAVKWIRNRKHHRHQQSPPGKSFLSSTVNVLL